jgi:NTP pyrophosphatase (non-canonical NTP hydrolase)
MDLNQLTREMHRFVEAKGWYEQESLRPQTSRNLAISLLIEASEVLEQFQWTEGPENEEHLAAELADVALYLMQLASVNGIDLENAILGKLQGNYKREWNME